VKLVKDDRIGRTQIVRIVQSPNLLGDRAFFAETPYACTATAMEHAQICFLEARDFREILGQNAEVLNSIAQRFAADLGRAEEYMNCISVCTVVERMASHLLAAWAASCASPKRSTEFTLAESRGELAEMLGTTPEAVSRALAELRAKDVTAINGRRIRILDEQRLRRVACLPAKTR
jgi:CRP-like cAMP-binding protein